VNKDELQKLLADVFAPWVQALDLTVDHVSGNEVDLRMKFDEQLCREGGIVCGQSPQLWFWPFVQLLVLIDRWEPLIKQPTL